MIFHIRHPEYPIIFILSDYPEKRKKKHRNPDTRRIKIAVLLWRRCGDLNPSAGGTDLPDFESGPFNHLGTSPYETPSRGDANIKRGKPRTH